MDIMNDAGVEIPGVKEETTIEDDDVHKVARQLLGKRLAKCFKSAGPQASEASSNNVCITVDPTFRRSRLSFDGLLVSNGVGSYCGNPCCVMAHEFVNWA